MNHSLSARRLAAILGGLVLALLMATLTPAATQASAGPAGTGLSSGFAGDDSVTATGQNCTYTQGYWKNHVESWPATAVPMTVGNESASQERLLEIFNTPPRGDATYILAHQFIAATLNQLNGADVTQLGTTLADAQSWLMSNPLGSKPKGATGDTGIALANTLDAFNNGNIGPGHCGDQNPPAEPTPTEAPPTPTEVPPTPTEVPPPPPPPVLQSLSGRVWDDANVDGLQNDGTVPLANVTVDLYQNGALLRSTLTDSNGGYVFADLTAGEYRVAVAAANFQGGALTGFHVSVQDANGNGNDDIDSDVNRDRGDASVAVTVVEGANAEHWDAGVYKGQKISGLVWNDSSADGLRGDPQSEPRFNAVRVHLLRASDQALVAWMDTNESGDYAFNDVPVGDYIVEVAPGNFDVRLNGYGYSPDNQGGDDSLDSDFNAQGWEHRVPVSLMPGVDAAHVDAGLHAEACTANLDIMYVLDLSTSMDYGYGDGTITKLAAAKQAIAETNAMIAGWNSNSRVGFTSFQGIAGAQTVRAYVENRVPYTLDFGFFNLVLGDAGASGTTPTAHAIRGAGRIMHGSPTVGNLPVMILISDGVPTVDADFEDTSFPSDPLYEGHLYNDYDVQPVWIMNPDGSFRSIADVRADGVPYVFTEIDGSTSYRNAGEPVADAMEAIHDVMAMGISNLRVHSVAIQGQPGSSEYFNPDILRYVAHVGNGVFAEPGDMYSLRAELQAAVETTACGN